MATEGRYKRLSDKQKHDMQVRNRVYSDLQTKRIVVRVPAGYDEKIKAYQKAHANEYKSVNEMICKWIGEKIGENYNDWKKISTNTGSNGTVLPPDEVQEYISKIKKKSH